MATTEKESVEALAERIVGYVMCRINFPGEATGSEIKTEVAKMIRESTMQPMDDGESATYGPADERGNRRGSGANTAQPQPPQPEPVVGERDRELARSIIVELRQWGATQLADTKANAGQLALIIARHNAAERTERLELMDRASHAETKCEELQDELERARFEWGNWESMWKESQRQLIEANARVKELEKFRDRACGEFLGLSYVVAAALENLRYPQPATPSEGK